jgi:hypothetical protein
MRKYEKAGLVCALLLGTQPVGAQAAEPSKSNYPSVFDQPSTSDGPGLTIDQRSKLKQDLIHARDRQGSQAKARDQIGRPKSTPPEKQLAH